MEDGEQLAIISGPGFGLRDTSWPVLWFGVSMLGAGALQCFQGQEALDFVKANDITDIKHLDGKPCVVDVQRNTVRFKRLFKP